MDTELYSLVRNFRSSAGELDKRRECVRELQEIVQRASVEWRIKAFGSSANGFGMAGSDLDVTCYKAFEAEQQGIDAAHELRNSLAPLLQNHPEFEVVDAVWITRVPILKLKFQGFLEVDISCQNTEALVNTEFLKAYAKLHPVVRILVMVVKLWAKGLSIVGAANRHLSSYSLTLMVIYFLQVQPDLSFPLLSSDFFSHGGQAATLGELHWTCPMELSRLLARFFDFFSSEFCWGSEVVSVRLGRRALAGDPEFMYLAGQAQWRLHVEDPFILGRNLNYVLGVSEERQLRDSFIAGASAMAWGCLPDGLRDFSDPSLKNDSSQASRQACLMPREAHSQKIILQKPQPDEENASTDYPSSAAESSEKTGSEPVIMQIPEPREENARTDFSCPAAAAGLSHGDVEFGAQRISMLLAHMSAPEPEMVPTTSLTTLNFWI